MIFLSVQFSCIFLFMSAILPLQYSCTRNEEWNLFTGSSLGSLENSIMKRGNVVNQAIFLLFLYSRINLIFFTFLNIIQLKILSKQKQRVAQRRTIFEPLVLARELWETILCLRRTINTQFWLEGTFGCRRTLLKTLPTNWKTWMISFQSITSNTQTSRGQHNPRGRTTTQLQETTSAFEYNFYLSPKKVSFY